MTLSSELIAFVAECPDGHLVVLQKERDELSNSLEAHKLTLRCDRCIREWTPDPELEQELRERLSVEHLMLRLGSRDVY